MHPNWLLPEFVDDVLPREAKRVELIRRQILDLFVVHGYELVSPPLIEYLESLLTGSGQDLELQTFKLVVLLPAISARPKPRCEKPGWVLS